MNAAYFWVQVAATVLIAFTFIIYLLQLKAMRSSSTAQNILAVINYLQDPDVRKARGIVQTDFKNKPLASWTEEERRAASLVQATYDVAGILIGHGLVPIDLFLRNWGGSIVRCFTVLAPYIEELRNQARLTPYGENFKRLRDEAERKGFSGGV
jgi:hypothetical protein